MVQTIKQSIGIIKIQIYDFFWNGNKHLVYSHEYKVRKNWKYMDSSFWKSMNNFFDSTLNRIKKRLMHVSGHICENAHFHRVLAFSVLFDDGLK